MSVPDIYKSKDWVKDKALITTDDYEKLYSQSITDPISFWGEQGKRLDWYTPYTKIRDYSYNKNNLYIKWYEDGILNASYNCIDRHIEKNGDKVAILWEGDDPKDTKRITYKELLIEVCKFSNGLKSLGIKKGDRVTIYMPMIPEAAVAMLSCTRIGAIHSVVFGGFSPEALAGRLEDCNSKFIITSDEGVRGGKLIPLKRNVDNAISKVNDFEKCIVVKRTGNDIPWNDKHDHWYHDLINNSSGTCEPERMSAEDPMFILYTSGSTGKPKGVLHTTGGYLVYASLTHQYVFDYHNEDIYWCTADVGWVTGHSYIIYGPLCNGATTVMFEGVPNYPTASRFWEIVDKHKINILYTAPTAIRALMSEGNKFLDNSSRKSLRILGSVGEPINPEAWRWYYDDVGNSECSIVDTWWQTETGGIMITPLVGAIDMKPGSATLPFFGIKPSIVDQDNQEIKGPGQGSLCIDISWPGQMRSVYGDHERFIDTYFKQYPGRYFSGDGCRRDDDGYYWITGRMDDVINVSGHRLGTAEVESALVLHQDVSEAAVVGYPHDIKGEGLYAFVTLNKGTKENNRLEEDLLAWVKKEIGSIAKPDFIQFTNGLPKTRSGKIMRRILRKIATNDYTNLGDTSTLADPNVVDELIQNRKNI
ncbi:acetate--CoA ligase [Gammaproteobacteria bacterium]|nr:acetate--CoA ligase [Gammaproteobacteria bacterium]